jgi:hypothetical protein
MKMIFSLLSFTIATLLTGCIESKPNPQVSYHQDKVMQQFTTLVHDQHNYICKAKMYSPSSSYKRAKAAGKTTNDGTVTFIFDFKDYPNNVNIECKDQSYSWCDDALYEKFEQRHHTSIKIQNNTIFPVHDKYHYDYHDAQIKILDVHDHKVDIYLSGQYDDPNHTNLIMECVNPLQQVKQVTKIETFKSSPYSDAVLLKKLDKALDKKPSRQKYNEVKTLIEYGVYISEKSLYKALGTVLRSDSAFRDTPADYRVLKLLQINSGISDKELFSPRLTRKFLEDEDDRYWMVEYAIDDAFYGNSEYEKMNGYAFADYFAKLGIFDKELTKFLEQDYSNINTPKLPTDLKQKLYKHLFASKDEERLINLALHNFMVDPQFLLPPLRDILLHTQQEHIKELNIFLIKLFAIPVYKIDIPRRYFKKEDYNRIKTNQYNPSAYRQKYPNPQSYFEESYNVIEAFLKQSKPDKLTAELYSYIDEHQTKTLDQNAKRKILALLNTQNTASLAKAQEYHAILEKMVHDDDVRGARFYLKKGAIGDPRIMMEALKKGMDDVAQTIALQDIHFDPESVLKRSIALKKYNFVAFLLKNNKVPKELLPDAIYTLLRTNTPQSLKLADAMVDYGADTSKAFLIAQKNYDEKTLQRVAQRYPTAQNKALLLSYQKEQARLKKERQEAAKRARLAEQKRQEALQKAYMAHKYVGQKVCKDGRVSLFLNITMSGYVEDVRGENIEIRIANTEGTTPYYNGVTLYPNKIIWDKYYEWRACK